MAPNIFNDSIFLASYLGCLSLVPLVFLAKKENQNARVFQLAIIVQCVGLAVFFLIFGGYSIDAWRYLTRFTHNPFGFDEEWLFWLVGHFLNGTLPNPWPVKILSVLAVGLWVAAVIRAIGFKRKEALVLGLALLPLMPAFFFAMGNAIRQGLAAVIVLHAILFFVKGKKWQFGVLAITGVLVHQVSLVFVIAGAFVRAPRKLIWFFLIMAPFVSFGVSIILELWGINLADYVRYGHRDDGQFHYLKFAVYFIMAIGLLIFSTKREVPNHIVLLINAFALTVGCASLLLMYEVPFERILLYADVLLPIVIATVLTGLKLRARSKQLLWSGVLCLGLLLWTSDAVNRTLTAGIATAEDGRIESYQIPD